jgi:haloalkane dehalogenase
MDRGTGRRVERTAVGDVEMAYVEAGSGGPIVFVHGNPTSSYLWRDVIPHVDDLGWCVAPDLVGMGASEKLPESGPDSYRFVEHRDYLERFLATVGADRDVVLVGHDWGSALVFDWANRHRDAVRGIAYMEAIVASPSWSDWPEPPRELFRAIRSDAGEQICLEKNVFVERILPASVIRDLSADEMDAYRAPYLEPGESRRPTLTWPREIPFDGEPTDVDEVITSYSSWLAQSAIPKLYVRAEPGFLTPWSDTHCRDWPNQREVTVAGIHFIQEDSPTEIGEAIRNWVAELE